MSTDNGRVRSKSSGDKMSIGSHHCQGTTRILAKLAVIGQGVVILRKHQRKMYSDKLVDSLVKTITISADNDDYKMRAFQLRLSTRGARISAIYGGNERILAEAYGDAVKLESDERCSYWFSLDPAHSTLRCGKGEARLETTGLCLTVTLAEHVALLEQLVDVVVVGEADDTIRIEPLPVVLPTPLYVIDKPQYHVQPNAIVFSDLPTAACRRLYHTVAALPSLDDAPDFPDFTGAIQHSIDNPQGWCHQFLRRKQNFGKSRQTNYLRIALDPVDGRAPGSRRVLEIWPAGHESPIHRHAEANGIIRVLHGEIDIALFAWLSTSNLKAHTVAHLRKGDITWLSADLNQVHQVRNTSDRCCITLQCYQYGEDDHEHYKNFDYVDERSGQVIAPFKPVSDMCYVEFRERMRREKESCEWCVRERRDLEVCF